MYSHYKYNLLRLFILLLVTGSGEVAWCQMARLFTSEDGLPSTKIGRLFQDGDGFIWVCTGNGVARFDGVEFEAFNFNRNDTFSVSSDLVLDVFEDQNKKLWVATSESLQVFDPNYNTFTNVRLHDPGVDPDLDYYVTSIKEVPSQKGVLLIATSGRGIYIVDTKRDTQDLEKRRFLTDLLGTTFINNLFFDSEGRLWVQTERKGLIVIDYGSLKLHSNIWEHELKDIAGKLKISAIIEDKDSGDILIGTFNHGLLVYKKDTGKIRRAKGKMAQKAKITCLVQRQVSDLFLDSSSIWVGTEDNGVFVFDKEEEIQVPKIKNSSYDLSEAKIHALMEDHQGNIWIGVFQKGLLVIPRSMYGFDHHNFSQSNASGLKTASVTGILKDETDESLWVGTDGGGVYHVNKDNSFKNFSNKNSALTNNSVLSLIKDSRGTIWIATYINGLYSYSPEKGIKPFAKNAELSSLHTSSLVEDTLNDVLYVATLGGGLNIIENSTGNVYQLENKDINKWAAAITFDSSNHLWIGTYGGARCFDPKSQRLITYNLGIASSARVYGFCESSSGIMWIGSGEGLIAFDKRTNTSVVYTKQDGLSSNVIISIVESKDGKLWVSTNHGLSRYDPESGSFKNYFAHDGLQQNEFNPGAGFIDRDGEIYFGGINGITSFYPLILDQQVHKMSELYFSELKVLNETVRYESNLGKKNKLDKHITQANRVQLQNHENMFSISFSVLEYTNPKKVVYRYKMKGFDNEWKYTDASSRVATYTNLPFGDYTFEAGAFFEGEPLDHVATKQLSIRILPPWYHTWWAYCLYFIIVGLLVWVVFVFMKRRKQIIAEKAAMEKKDMRLKMYSNISHEIRSPLTLMIDPLKKLRKGDMDVNQKDLCNIMHRNSQRVLRLLNQLTDLEKIENKELILNYSEADLVFFLNDIMQSFNHVSTSHKIDFQLYHNTDTIPAWIDQTHFDKVIFNLLVNAFNLTPDEGRISISISPPKKNRGELSAKIDSCIDISIENTGNSLSEHSIDQILDQFYQPNRADGARGTGIGLNLARLLVELHQGKISIYNKDRDKVVYSITIPFGNAHLSLNDLRRPSSEGLFKRSTTSGKERGEYIDTPLIHTGTANEKPGKSKQKLVIVDDNEDLCHYIGMELQSDYNIEIHHNAKEAWDAISTSFPNAVVTDLLMEKMEGLELCRKIKTNPETNHISVIVLTSHTDDMSEQLCIDNGADRYLTKPVSLDLLKSCIAQTILTRETIKNKYRIHVDYGFHNLDLKTDDNKLIIRVIKEIRKNIHNPELSVEFLSKELGMSRIHLNRKLKELIKTSPSNLIKTIRMKQSAFLLIKHKVNISEVAYLVGFSTHSYFSNCFREFFGMTPKEFVIKYVDCNDEEVLNRFFE